MNQVVNKPGKAKAVAEGGIKAVDVVQQQSASFAILLFLVAVDYIGIGRYIGFIDVLHLPLLLIFFVSIALAAKHGVSEFLSFSQTKLLIVYMILTAMAMLHGLIASYAFPILKQQVVYFMFVFLCFWVIDSRKRIDQLTSILVMIHVLLVILNLEHFGGERVGVYEGGVFMGDGNDFAWSVNIAIPFSFYWVVRSASINHRAFCVGLFIVLLVGVIGTASRGAFLTLGAMLLYYVTKISAKKTAGIFILLAIALVGAIVAPPQYTDRLETIGHYEQDSSATGRIEAWRAATAMAIDHPVLGVGAGSFSSAYGRSYRREGGPVRWISTHSIYFKILSEYSFFGLAIYLGICFSNLRTNTRTWQRIKDDPDSFSIDPQWPRYLNMSIIGFMVGGVFLTGVNYVHIFLLTALTMATSKLATKEALTMSSGENAKRPQTP